MKEDTVTDRPLVSVIVPVYNEVGTIKTCLDNLLNQSYPRKRYEVIVVDNGSTDATTTVVQEYPVRLVSAADGGPYFARNFGIDRASGAVLAFTDADVSVADDWIESGVRAVQEAGRHAVVYGVISPSVDGQPTWWELYEIVHTYRGIQRYTWNLFTTPSVFERVGPFGNHYLSGGDIEWADRVDAAGIPIHYDDSVSGTHSPRTSPTALFLRSIRLGYGAGQRLRTNFDDTTATLIAKEPLRLADWYAGKLRILFEDSDDVPLTLGNRLACAAISLPLGVGLAYGRLRGLLENSPARPVGDYR